MLEMRKKLYIFYLFLFFFLNYAKGHVKCSSDQDVETFLIKVWSLRIQKTILNWSFKHQFLSQIVLLGCRLQIWVPFKRFLAQKLKKVSQRQQSFINSFQFFFRKRFCGHLECIFDQRAESFPQKWKKILWIKKTEIFYFTRRNFCVKIFICERIKQFWLQCWKLFVQRASNVLLYFLTVSPERTLGHAMQNANLKNVAEAKHFFSKSQKFFLKVQYIIGLYKNS